MSRDFDQAVQREIEKTNYIIENFGEEKEKYQNLKNKINNELIPKLRAAKNWIVDAKSSLVRGYDSEEVKKRSDNLQSNSEKIDTMINMLNRVIIPQINANINSSDTQIENAKADLNRYRNMLN